MSTLGVCVFNLFFFSSTIWLFNYFLATQVGLCIVHGIYKFHFSATFLLKMGSTILFTHLKIILLQYFQFSAIQWTLGLLASLHELLFCFFLFLCSECSVHFASLIYFFIKTILKVIWDGKLLLHTWNESIHNCTHKRQSHFLKYRLCLVRVKSFPENILFFGNAIFRKGKRFHVFGCHKIHFTEN